MKKIYLFLIASIMVFGAFAQDKVNVDLKEGAAIVLDGIEDEALWEAIPAVLLEKNFTGEEPTVDAYWKAFYTEEYIYILVNVEDDEHYPAWEVPADAHWEYDKPEIYFDVNDALVDGGGGNNSNGHWQYAPGFAEADYDVPVFGGDMGGVVEWCYSLTGESYVVEYKFPINSMSNADGVVMDLATLKALPEKVGFDVTVIDRETGDAARKRKVWQSDGTIAEAWANMDGAGTITLTDEKWNVGVKEVASLSMNVYPNPVQDQLTIEGSFNKVVISNIIGQQVKVIETSSRTINVSDLSKGVYVVKAYDNGVYQGTAKVTKN